MRLQQRLGFVLTLVPLLQVRRLVWMTSKISSTANRLGLKKFERVGIDPPPGGSLLRLGRWVVSAETQIFNALASWFQFPILLHQHDLPVILWWSAAAMENCTSMACSDARVSF